jgi:hypothetical protein
MERITGASRECPHSLLPGGETEVASGAHGGLGEGFALGEAVGDFVADDGAEFGVGGFFLISVAGASEI